MADLETHCVRLRLFTDDDQVSDCPFLRAGTKGGFDIEAGEHSGVEHTPEVEVSVTLGIPLTHGLLKAGGQHAQGTAAEALGGAHPGNVSPGSWPVFQSHIHRAPGG